MKVRLLALCVVFAVSAFAQQKTQDALIADPDVHKLVLENEHFRVFEARASRGTVSPAHTHQPMVFISLSTARVRSIRPDGTAVIFDTFPGQAIWMEGLEHSWKLLSGEVHVIAVEIKSAANKQAKPQPVTRKANDAVAVDPDTHHVLFDNDHVRVFDGKATKGAKSPMHSHPATLLVVLGKGRGKITMPDGKSVLHDYTPGDVMWAGDGMEHSWEMLSGEPHVIAIEVKSAHKAPAAAK